MKNHYLTRFFALVFFLGATISLTKAQTFEVTAPMGVAGTYNIGVAVFGPQFDSFSGEVVEATDIDGLTTGCVAIDNAVADVTGKVALIDRGACAFTQKVLNAQAAGASAVIICNNDTANPDAVINLGGSDNCQSTTPAVMLSYNDCQTLRVETGVMVTYTAPDTPAAGENFDTAIEIGEGSFTIDSITGDGGLFTNSVAAAFYAYTPSAVGVATISSCGGGADSRLIVIQGDCAGVASGNILTFSIDDCDDGGGNVTASTLDLLVFPDQTYYLVWDDAQSADGFDFSVSLGALPTVTTTFTVNLEQETVAAVGAYFHWDINGVPTGNAPMTDNGDGTWSYDLEVTTLDTITYVYCNGEFNFEVVPEECAFPNFQGDPVRQHIETSIVDSSVPTVCYSLCTNCPSVDVTFTVNMANETVNPAGVTMAWGTDPASQNVLPLTDNGDGTWSGTVSVMSGDTIGYFFANGLNPITDLESVPADCGVPSGLGFNVRIFPVEGFEDITVAPVCFGACTSFCPDLGCGEPAILMENLDNYDEGFVGPQSDVWTTWSGTEGGAEDGLVSSEQSFSAPNSLKIEGQNGPMDVLLLLGNQTAGNWDLRFKMYVPSGSYGYYNIQDDEVAGQQWNLEVSFDDGGTGSIVDGGSFTYTQDTWFDVIHRIDLDNDFAELIIDGQAVHTWVFGPDWKIGSFDFFPNNNGPNLYYVDDISFRPLPPCPTGAIICDGFEIYSQSEVSAQSPFWAPWTSSPADDGIVTAEEAHNGSCQSLKITADDPDDQLLLLGDRTEGNYLLEWWMYVPEGNAGYYNMQKFQDAPGSTGSFAHQVEFFTDGTATLDAGAADVVTWNWTPGTWMHIQHFIDLDNDWFVYVIDGVEIYAYPASWGTFAQSGAKQIGSIDFFGNTDVIQYIDDVLFQQLPSIPGNLCGGAIDINDHLGGGAGNTLSSGPYNNNDYTSVGDPEVGYECFGETSGAGEAPSLERTIWYTFVGDGEAYSITAPPCGDDPIDSGDTQIAIYSGSCGALTPVACAEDIDIAGGNYTARVDSLQTEEGVTYYMFVDGFGPDFPADGEFCLEFTQLTLSPVSVTFNVDMNKVIAYGEVSAEGVHIAGSFQGWDPAATPMTDNGDGTWSVTVEILPGEEVQYKYINGNAWGADETGITTDCGIDDGQGNINRLLVVGDEDIQTPFYCFNTCVTCALVNVSEEELEAAVNIFPNPAKDIVNVRFELSESTDNLHLRLVNALGQTVFATELGQVRAENYELNVSNYPAGTYMIQLVDGNTQVTKSVVIQ